MPDDRTSNTVLLRRLAGGLLAGGLLLATAGCVWVNPTPTRGHGSLKLEYLHEEPLEIGGPVHELTPPLAAGVESPRFSDRSRFYVWSDSTKGMLMGAEISGAVKELAPYQGRWDIDWTADGKKFLVTDLAAPPQQGPAAIPYRTILYSPDGEAPVSLGEMSDPRALVLPDGSGLTYTRLVNEPEPSTMMPGPDLRNRNPKRLMTRLPQQAEQEETVLAGPGVGYWSHDAQHYAYLAHRDGDPVNGLDLRVYDRQSKTSALRYHIESDDLGRVMNGLSWSADNTVWLAQACQVQASASIAVTAIPIDGKAVTLSIVPVSLEEGETIESVRLSPDQSKVSFETSKTVTLTDGQGSVTGPRSTGIVVGYLETGKTRRLTSRGRVVTWLPGGDDLVAMTGYGPEPWYYRIDIPAAEEIQ